MTVRRYTIMTCDTQCICNGKKGALLASTIIKINVSQYYSKMMKKTLQQGFTEKLPGTVRRVVS